MITKSGRELDSEPLISERSEPSYNFDISYETKQISTSEKIFKCVLFKIINQRGFMIHESIFSKNKRGISAIIVTLLMIVLSLVAVGAVWVVINNVLGAGTAQIGSGTKCLDVDIKATTIKDTTVPDAIPANTQWGSNYDLTLTRSAKGEAIGGVKLVISNGTSNSEVLDFGVALAPLETKKQALALTTNPVANATKVEITPYFIDASGNQQLCQQTSTSDFN